MKLKDYCQKNGIPPERAVTMIVGEGSGILPKRKSFENYFAIVTESAIICHNERIGVDAALPFSQFTYAEFGVGAAKLWLQCVVGESEIVFALSKKEWKSDAGKLILQGIAQHTPLLDQKEYDNYTQRSMFRNMWK